MRLKRLELSGFKSFVDPTKIEIGVGVSAIVGPNGCGKSNIVDAIRWVLGEHSARHLRGGVMEDLIFQGSDSRPPVAVADVELTFSVKTGQLPPPYHELEEVSIRRRMHRESGSDAFINGKSVRMKDIVDLFLDTGISTRAYAIIEQGAIARMITARPEERRSLLEEAAGVVKYRSRRREAERKMEDTRQNLERVTDLLDEVASQCRSLKQQASRAEKFKAMQEEHRLVQAQSMAIRYAHALEHYAAIEERLGEARLFEEEAATLQTAAELALHTARQELVAHESDAQRVQDRLREAELARSHLQQQAERLAGERKLLAERIATLTQRIDEATRRGALLSEQLDEIDRQLVEKDDTLLIAQQESARELVEQCQQRFSGERQRRDELFAASERLRAEFEGAARRKQQAEGQLARLRDKLQRLFEQQSRIRAQSDEANRRQREAVEAAALAAETKGEAEMVLEEAQLRLDSTRTRREEAAVSLRQGEAELRRLSGEVEELRGRTVNREVADELRQRLRARGAVWIDESLQVPEGLEQAVAAALRGRAADALLSALPLEEWRTDLLAAREAPVAWFVGADHAAVAESLAAAIGLHTHHPLYPLFTRVQLCDDIFTAAAPSGDAIAVVSRDGWRLEAGGWLLPPSQSRTARQLALQRQLQQKSEALDAARAQVAEQKAHFEQSEQELVAAQRGWQQAHLAATESGSRLHAAEAAVNRLKAEADSLAAQLARLGPELEESEREQNHWQEQLLGAEMQDDSAMLEAQQQLALQSERSAQAEQSLIAARGTLASAGQALALHEQALKTLQRERQRLAEEQRQAAGQVEFDSQRRERHRHELSEAEEQQEFDLELAEAAEAVELLHRELNRYRSRGQALQQTLHNHEQGERQARSRQGQLAEARQRIELELATESARLSEMAENIERKLQLTPQQLLDGLSAEEAELDVAMILQRAQELEERLSRFGPVNLLAIEEYEQAAEREGFLANQSQDLTASLETLKETIDRIDRTTRQRFRDVFEQTNAIFQQTFPHLFGGGRAELRLDSDDVLTAGVEVIAQPPGKRLQEVTLLSGGEKALTAVALVFSIFRIKPAPFCILDEVDAPLDDANVGRFSQLIRDLSTDVQFLAISHNKITMQQADRLIGVSMPEPGVSKIVAVDMEGFEASHGKGKR